MAQEHANVVPFSEQMTQALCVPVPSLPPTNAPASVTPVTSDGIDMRLFHRVMAHIAIGAITTTGSLQAYWTCSSTSNGVYVPLADSMLPIILTLVFANTEGTLEVRADQLNPGTRFVKLNLLTITDSVYQAASIYGVLPAHIPARQYDIPNIIRVVT